MHTPIAQLRDVERTSVQERTNDFLRALYPTKTADNVAADTGISANTVSKWLDRGSAPTSWALLRPVSAYGSAFLVAVMERPPAWLDRAAREDERRKVEAQIAALQERLTGGEA